MSEDGCPRFYANDITSILKERNALKEKVLELEEEIVGLKREITRLSNFGTLTLNSKAEPLRRIRANALLSDATQSEQSLPATTALQKKKLKHCTETSPHISDVDVTGYKKKGRYYVYVINLTWSDGQRYEIYRRYGEFFTFQHTLLQLFPEEGGKGKTAVRIIPSLPTIDNVLSLFGRTNTESIVKARLDTINEYCQILALHLDEKVSQSPYVLNFFRPFPGDTQRSRLKRRDSSDVDLSVLSVYPQKVPAGSQNLFEEYTVLADYEATTPGELSAKAGDKVEVMRKEDSGWWLVKMKTLTANGKVGFISKDYLKSQSQQDIWRSMSSCELQQYLGFACHQSEHESGLQLKYVAVEDYITEDHNQLCLKRGELVLVVETSEDGWWLALCNGKQGWVPASYLHSQDSQTDTSNGVLVPKKGEECIASADYCAECDGDISFPEGARVEVLERAPTGWWVVRYDGEVGVAPASCLQFPWKPAGASAANTTTQNSMDLRVFSGIVDPPPRSEIFRQSTIRKLSKMSRAEAEGKSNGKKDAKTTDDKWTLVDLKKKKRKG